MEKINFSPALNEDELKIFKKALNKEYPARKDVELALQWAYSKLTNSIRVFPKIIVIGKERITDFVNEYYLGKLVFIQPGVVFFFAGDDLTKKKNKYLWGQVRYCKNNDLFRMEIVFKDFEISCQITESNIATELKFFWQIGLERDANVWQYNLDRDLHEKIIKWF